jgi:hypothetical protein
LRSSPGVFTEKPGCLLDADFGEVESDARQSPGQTDGGRLDGCGDIAPRSERKTTVRVRTVRNPKVGLAVLAAAGLALLTAVPADAATTTVTFTLTGGALTITAPATANLGTAAVGTATLSGSLGAVTVTDARGAPLGTWTASVFSTNFTTGGGTANETIAATAVNYASLSATSTTGTAVLHPRAGDAGARGPAGYHGAGPDSVLGDRDRR